MLTNVVPDDPAVRRKFDIAQVVDPRDMERCTLDQRLPRDIRVHTYRLQDRDLLHARFEAPITSMASRRLGPLYGSHMVDRFATEIGIGGGGVDRYCFAWTLRGRTTLVQNGVETTAAGTRGLVYRGDAGTRLLTSDGNERQNVWIEASALEGALEDLLGDRPRQRLAFAPALALDTGPGATLFGHLRYIVNELKRPDGLAENPLAQAACADLVLRLVLGGLAHNHAGRLRAGPSRAIPAHLRRAEEFLRANAIAPLRMKDVARAADCSVRSLGEAFRRFRDTTPLAALRAIRLERAREALRRGTGDSTAEIARRHGFTNAGRFIAAYRRRFHETPGQTARETGPRTDTTAGSEAA